RFLQPPHSTAPQVTFTSLPTTARPGVTVRRGLAVRYGVFPPSWGAARPGAAQCCGATLQPGAQARFGVRMVSSAAARRGAARGSTWMQYPQRSAARIKAHPASKGALARNSRYRDSQYARLVFSYPRLPFVQRSEEHTSELQSRGHLVCRLLLEKKK